jgi:hypothetical protein
MLGRRDDPLTCAPLAVSVSERDQLLGKHAPLKATVDFHPVIVRQKQKLASRRR